MSNSASCEYHPDRIAIAKCERCLRLICVNDKTIYRRTISSGTGSHRYRRTETYEYCPMCYNEQKINDATGAGAVFGSIFFIVFGIIWIGMTRVIFPPFTIIGVGLIIFAIYNIVTGPQKAEAARARQDQFLKSLDQNPKGITTREMDPTKSYGRRQKWSNYELTCFQCGNQITIADDYCMNCGDSTVEERKKLSN